MSRVFAPSFIRLLVLHLLCGVGLLRAAELSAWSRWSRVQALQVPQEQGLVRVELPVETLNFLQPTLADLRLVTDSGRELPWAVDWPVPPRTLAREAAGLSVSLEEDHTVVSFELPQDSGRPELLELESPASVFNKPVRLETSPDGRTWSVLADKLPLVKTGRQGAVLPLRLPPGASGWLRLVIDDRRTPAVPVVRIVLHSREVDPAAPVAVACSLGRREDVGGETRLEILLPGAGLHLSSLEIAIQDQVFRRPVRLVRQCFSDDRIEEQVLSDGLLSRYPIHGQADQGTVRFDVERRISSGRLILVVENGDNPPLSIQGLVAKVRPVRLVFVAPERGSCWLLGGARNVPAPHYDIASMGADFRLVPSTTGNFGPVLDNQFFREFDRGPDFPVLGPELDASAWQAVKSVLLKQSGVQRLELDLAVMARAGNQAQDLRLLRGNQQVPFVLESCSFSRSVPLALEESPPAGSTKTSRWVIQLPYAGLPLSQLTLFSKTPVFERNFRLYELRLDGRGQSYQFLLGEGTWARTSSEGAGFVLAFHSRPASGVLYLEAYDGDNLPVSLEKVAGTLPVRRLYFKTNDAQSLLLYYGNPYAHAPSYDLRLVGGQLLASDVSQVSLGQEELLKPGLSAAEGSSPGFKPGWVFWCSISLVIVGLLFVVSKLLPKPPAGT